MERGCRLKGGVPGEAGDDNTSGLIGSDFLLVLLGGGWCCSR